MDTTISNHFLLDNISHSLYVGVYIRINNLIKLFLVVRNLALIFFNCLGNLSKTLSVLDPEEESATKNEDTKGYADYSQVCNDGGETEGED